MAGSATPGPAALPPKGEAPVSQGFALEVRQPGKPAEVRTIDANGFPDITFRGEYPIARLSYRDQALPVQVDLEAFSPFIPLDLDSSSLPATIFSFQARNISDQPVEISLAGWLENAACRYGDGGWSLSRVSQVERRRAAPVVGSIQVNDEAVPRRPDRVVENWSQPTYEGWTVQGTAFGTGPITRDQIPDYQGNVGGPGQRLVNSHASAPGHDVASRDACVGRLTSGPFMLDRRFLSFWIGGGSHKGQTCLNLLVEGQVVRSATGSDDNRMSQAAFDLRDLPGKIRHDPDRRRRYRRHWGNIGIGPITLTDRPAAEHPEDVPGYGSMALTLLGNAQTFKPWRISATTRLPRHCSPASSEVTEAGHQPARPSAGQRSGEFGHVAARRPGQLRLRAHVVLSVLRPS